MPIRARFSWLPLVCLLLLSSCSGYERLLKSNDVNKKLTKANELYDKKQYLKASQLYESLMPVVKHTKNYEAIYFRYAYSYFYMEDYMSASYHFRNFTEFFPNSPDVVEAEYMHGYCLYKFSPKSSLDPTYTSKAIGALQTFATNHPNSKFVKDANTQLDELRSKLEKKDSEAAKLYLNIGQYKAASVAYASVMETYPESDKVDEYQYYIAKSLYLYARESIKAKQEERYINAMNAYNSLKEEYPHSPFVKEGLKYYQLAEDNLKKLRNEHK